jgi:PAS domain S-box-containing protein
MKVFAVVFVLFALFAPVSAAANDDTRTVLLLLSYNQGFAWTDDVVDGVTSVIPPDADTDLRIEYMDTKRASGDEYFEQLFRIYQTKYRTDKPDVIIAEEEDAYLFLKKYRDDLFPDTPVVVVGLNWRDDRQAPEFHGCTGVMEDYEISRTIDLALALQPGTQHLVVVNDNISTAGKENDHILQGILPAYEDDLDVIMLSDLTAEDLGLALERIPARSVILLLTYNQDAEGRIFTYDEMAARITRMTDAPVYGVWDFYLGKGIVGGYMTRGFEQGVMGGEIAAEILNGTPAAAIAPVVARPQAAIFDYQELERQGIPLSALPEGSAVINRPQTSIEVPLQTVYLSIVAGIALTALLSGLVLMNRRLKRAQKSIKRSEELLSAALAATNDGIWDWDLTTNTTYFSPSYYRMLGYEPGSFPQSYAAWEALLHPDDRERVRGEIAAALAVKGANFQTDFRMLTKEGEWKWILGRGRVVAWEGDTPVRMSGTHVDFTGRKRAEIEREHYRKTLEEQVAARTADLDLAVKNLSDEVRERKAAEFRLASGKERLAVTLRSIGDGVIATDTEGRIEMMNRAAEEITGWKGEEVLGKHLWSVLKIFDETSRQPREDPTAQVMRDNAIIELPRDTVLVRKDGSERIIADSAAPIRDAKSRIIGVVIVFRDVTAARQADEERIQAQKLESLGLLAGGIAHDFNNFLMGILGNIQFAAEGMEEGDIRLKYLKDAESALFRARDLTAQLLTFARGGAPVRRARHLGEMIRETATFTLRGSGSRPAFEIPEDLMAVNVDLSQIAQVIGNLVLNAAQAMEGGGIVTLTAKNVDVGEETPLQKSGRYVRIEVSDTGTGIPPAILPKIFDPYFTTKAGGRGLGLPSCLSIVKKHDGWIDVRSEVGTGTTFSVYLPAAEEKPVHEEAIETEPEKTACSGHVLIMDDEEPIRTVMQAMLTRKGFFVDGAEDGAAAIELYRRAMEAGEPYDAVVLDMTIPGGMGGRETMEQLREIDPAVRAIVSSGYSQDPVMASYADYGFAAALPKPYRIQDLVDAIKEICRGTRR